MTFTVKTRKTLFTALIPLFQFCSVLISSVETNKMLLIDKVMTAPAANDQSLLIISFPARALPFFCTKPQPLPRKILSGFYGPGAFLY